MPVHRTARSLQDLSCRVVASILLDSCKDLDTKIHLQGASCGNRNQQTSPRVSPRKSPAKQEVWQSLNSGQRRLLQWLSHLPETIVEDVIKLFLSQLESFLLEDIDNKLILTLINIDKMKMNDFFFGVHSLLSLVQAFQLTSLHFTKRLWFCLWQYAEITSSKHLSDKLCSSLPGLTSLTSLNVPHVADDRLVFTITKHLHNLLVLDMSNSRVSDRGLRFFAAADTVAFMRPRSPDKMVTRNLEDMMEASQSSHMRSRVVPNESCPRPSSSCFKLERLNLQSCDSVTEKGIVCVLENLKVLKVLEYHQKSSVLEILIKWTSKMREEKRLEKTLGLTDIEHGFPYGLSPLSSHLSQLSLLVPSLTSITLVTTDSSVANLAVFPNLTRLSLELEDCLGEGLLELLSKSGSRLEEICLACSSDPDTSLTGDEPGLPAQLFNLGLISIGLLAPQVVKLSLSGCGLVTSQAVRQMSLQERLGDSAWLKRQSNQWFKSLTSLILMSYEESNSAMALHSGLLKSIVSSAKFLRILNLEGSFGSFFTDSYLASMLSLNPLSSLKILDVSVSEEQSEEGRIPLTISSVRQILNSCPLIKELRISDWRVTTQEFKNLQALVKEKNWDLVVTKKTEQN